MEYLGDVTNDIFIPNNNTSWLNPMPVSEIFCDNVVLWSRHSVRVTANIRLVCARHNFTHGKISVLGNPKTSDKIWDYVRRPSAKRPKNMYLVKVAFSDQDFKNIEFLLHWVIPDLEKEEIPLYNIDIMRDFADTMSSDELVANLIDRRAVIAKENLAVKTVQTRSAVICTCKIEPHVSIQWYDGIVKVLDRCHFL